MYREEQSTIAAKLLLLPAGPIERLMELSSPDAIVFPVGCAKAPPQSTQRMQQSLLLMLPFFIRPIKVFVRMAREVVFGVKTLAFLTIL